VGEPLAGLASVLASSAPHALRGRDRDLVRLLPGTEARSVWAGSSCPAFCGVPVCADATLTENLGAALPLRLPEWPFRRSGILRCWRLHSRISSAVPNLSRA